MHSDRHWIAAPHRAQSRDSTAVSGAEDDGSTSVMDTGEGDDSGLSWYDFGALSSGAGRGRSQFLLSVSKRSMPMLLKITDMTSTVDACLPMSKRCFEVRQ